MNPEDKNKAVSEQQQKHLEKVSEQEQQVEEIKTATPDELRAKLSKRNEDYLFHLHKILTESGLPEASVTEKINELLPDMVIAQRKGQPATQLYGTPQEKANEMINPDQKTSDIKFWQRAMDNALLYLAIFGGMFGIVGLFSKTQQPIGIVTIVSVGILFGVMMTYYNDLITRKKEERPAWWKLILGGIGIIVFIFVLITVSELPVLRIINPVFPAWAILLIAVVAFIYRRIFRAHYHIVESPFTPGPNQRSKR